MDDKLDTKKIESLHKLLAVFDTERLTSKDFIGGFKQVIDHVKHTQNLTVQHLQTIAKAVDDAVGHLATSNHGQISGLRDELTAAIEEKHAALAQLHEEAISRLDEAVSNVKDGKDADEDLIVEKVLAKIPPPAPTPIGEDFRNALEALQGDDKLDKSAIRGLDDLEKKVNNRIILPTNQGTGIADTTGNIGRFQYLKFPGSTITHLDDTATITVGGGGSGTVTSVASADGSVTVTSGTTAADLAVVKAPKLSTARTINGVSFDGTANITVADATKEATANKDASGGYVGLTLFKINFKNAANTFTNFFTNATTAARTYTFPDKDITVAGLVDITGTNSGTNTGDQTITLTSDVTGSGTGSFATTIAASAVSLSKMANVATATVFYRKTAGTGAPEVNTLATLKTDLGLTGTNSGDQTITLTGDATGSGTGSFATVVGKINGVALSGLATGILKNTTTTGVPSIATGADLPTMTATIAGAVPTPPNDTTKFLRGDGTFAVPPSAAGGIVRSINSISANTTAGATAATDYVYLCTGTFTITMPNATGNTNRYTIKNVGSGTLTIAFNGAQTGDGSTTLSLPVQNTSLDLISDGTNFKII